MIECICEESQTLKDFTDDHCAQASFYWSALLKNREIKVNGKKTGEDILLQAGDVVRYYLTPKQEAKPAFYEVYEDDNVFVIDKDSGVNSQAVFAALQRIYGENCRFIHRLDRNTRGLMIFALNERAERELLTAFKEKRVEKIYHALCFGVPKEKTAVLTAYLKKDEEKSFVRIFDEPVKGAETIVTEYVVTEEKDGKTKLRITLHTGKTHQIRAHMAHIGCPVAGDMKYGDAERNRAQNLTRQCLVAKRLAFSLNGALIYLNEKEFVSRFDV